MLSSYVLPSICLAVLHGVATGCAPKPIRRLAITVWRPTAVLGIMLPIAAPTLWIDLVSVSTVDPVPAVDLIPIAAVDIGVSIEVVVVIDVDVIVSAAPTAAPSPATTPSRADC